MPKTSENDPDLMRVSRACQTCEGNTRIGKFDTMILDNKATTLIIMVSITTILVTLFLVILLDNPRHAWELVNMIIATIFATIVLLTGTFNVNKKFMFIVFLLNLAYMIVYYCITNFAFITFTTWAEYYKYFDQIAHFNMGWILYHAFRSLFPKQSMMWSVLFGILFELGYELIEYSYGCTFGMWCITQPNELINFTQDAMANTLGSFFGAFVEYIFFHTILYQTKEK